jgi:hypothetical protein
MGIERLPVLAPGLCVRLGYGTSQRLLPISEPGAGVGKAIGDSGG